jgi:hypothetical protein
MPQSGVLWLFAFLDAFKWLFCNTIGAFLGSAVGVGERIQLS